MKVESMKTKSGNAVPNQFRIEQLHPGLYNREGEQLRSGTAFQSYDSIIAFIDYRGKIYLDRETWDYSPTTGKYRNQFLGMDKAKTKELIDSGIITLVNFNS